MRYSNAIDDLIRCLEATKLRIVLGRSVRGALWVCGASVGAFSVVALIRRVLPDLFHEVAPIVVAMATLVAGLVFCIVNTWRTAPTITRLARSMEEHYRLDERLSTVVEQTLGTRPNRLQVVHKALLRDATRKVGAIRPGDVVRLNWAQPASFLATAVIVAFGLQMFIPTLPRTLDSVADQNGMIQERRASIAEDLRRAATLVSRDAEETADKHLEAISLALERLASEVERKNIADQAIDDEVSRLAGHVAHAYDRHGEQRQMSFDGDLEALLTHRLGSDVGGDALTRDGSTDHDELTFGAAKQEAHPDHLADLGIEFQDVVMPSELPQPGKAGERDQSTSLGSEAGPVVRGFGYDEIDPQLQARMERERQIVARLRPETPMGGDIGGAGDGASVEPGAGSQPLFDEDGNEIFPEWGAAAGEDLELPSDEESSRRIRVDLPPDAEFTEVAAQAVEGGGWRREATTPVGAETLGLVNRDAVGKYFLSLNEEETQ